MTTFLIVSVVVTQVVLLAVLSSRAKTKPAQKDGIAWDATGLLVRKTEWLDPEGRNARVWFERREDESDSDDDGDLPSECWID